MSRLPVFWIRNWIRIQGSSGSRSGFRFSLRSEGLKNVKNVKYSQHNITFLWLKEWMSLNQIINWIFTFTWIKSTWFDSGHLCWKTSVKKFHYLSFKHDAEISVSLSSSNCISCLQNCSNWQSTTCCSWIQLSGRDWPSSVSVLVVKVSFDRSTTSRRSIAAKKLLVIDFAVSRWAPTSFRHVWDCFWRKTCRVGSMWVQMISACSKLTQKIFRVSPVSNI